MHVDPRRVNEIVLGKRSITVDTALRLARFFGVEPQMWLNLQTRYDLEAVRGDLIERIASEVRPFRAA